MKRHFAGRRPGLTWELLLAGTLAASAAFAQGPGGPPPPFGGPGGPPPPATVAGAPLSFLDAKLKLSSDQDAKIKQIQQDFRQQRDELMPRPDQRPQGGPPDRATMEADRAKVKKLDDAATQKIKDILTAGQKAGLDSVTTELEALRADAIPLEVYGDLKLTSDQEKQLTTLGTAAAQAQKAAMDKAQQTGDFQSVREAMQQSRQQNHEKVTALLTDTQRQVLETFRQSHPRPQFAGGPGAGGPPPDGGMGGPPPDGNGPPPPDGNGPPPPDGNGPPPPDGGGPPPPGF